MQQINNHATRFSQCLHRSAVLGFVLHFGLLALANPTLPISGRAEIPGAYEPENKIPEPSKPCSREVADWWRELREAGYAAADATARKEKAIKNTIARKRSRNEFVPDDEKDFMAPDELKKLNDAASTSKQKYMRLLRKAAEASYLLPIDDGPPVILHFNEPRYTYSARALKIEGIIKTRALFGEDGQVGRVMIVKGIDELDDRAIRAVYDLVFLPARKNGKFVAYSQPVIVEFKLR